MPRFRAEPNHPELLLAAIGALCARTVGFAVDSAMEAAHAHVAGDAVDVTLHVAGLATRVGAATGDIARLAAVLEASPAHDDQIAEAGAAIAGLQYSLLAVAAAVHEAARESAELLAAADGLRHAALRLDELLPGYQPCG